MNPVASTADTQPSPGLRKPQSPRSPGTQELGGAPRFDNGAQVGAFRLQRLLGSGGMGHVYQAEQLHPVQREVALKFMHERLGGGPALARFEIERQALARMSHPAIAQIFEAGTTEDGYPYLAMEFVSGRALDDHCRERALDLRARLRLLLAVCRGVHHAHQRGVLHLDLKPANVLVGEVDALAVPKIIDFGLAASAIGLSAQRAQHAGTPGYMSPEQAGVTVGEQVPEVDPRSDVYALGVMLYELLTDELPQDPAAFDISDPGVLRVAFEHVPMLPSKRLAAADKAPLRSLLRQPVNAELDAVVSKALKLDPAARYDSAAELAEDLSRFLDHRPVRALPNSAWRRLRWGVRRHRLVVALGASVLLALLTGLSLATYGLLEARAERDRATAREAELERLTRFQQLQLESLEPGALGLGFRQSLEQQYAEALADSADAEPRLLEFRQALNEADATEAARRMLDEQMLVRAVQAIEQEYAPGVTARKELLLSVARAYRRIGAHDKALALIDRVLGEQATPAQRWLRAEILRDLGQRARMDTELESILATPASDREGRILHLRARLMRDSVAATHGGRLLEVAAALPALLQAFEAEMSAQDPQLRAIRMHIAQMITRAGRPEDAVPLLQQGLAQAEAQEGADSLAVAEALDALTSSLLALGGQGEEAEVLAERAVAIRRERQGGSHPDTLTSLNFVAVALGQQQRRSEAQAMMESILARRRAVQGNNHPLTLRAMLNHAAHLSMADRVEEATVVTREVYERRLRSLGPDALDVYTASGNLVEYEIINGEAAEALSLALTTVRQRSRLMGKNHPEVRVAEGSLGRALVVTGHCEEAIPLLEAQLLEQTAKPLNYSQRNNAMVAWYLSRCYREAGRQQESAWLLRSFIHGLTEATHNELNPPQRHSLAQYRQWLASQAAAR